MEWRVQNATNGKMETRLGPIVFNERGYIVAKVLSCGPGSEHVIGYSLIGPASAQCLIYANRAEALEALHDIETKAAVAAPPAP